jgi:hypothetical protein
MSAARALSGERPSESYFGKYAGIVVDNGPPQSGPHRGELLVRVPGLLEEDPSGKGNRPLEVTAAPSFLPGFFFVPDKGAQVWVEFVAGDINFPIWTGVWYPASAVPSALAGAPTEQNKLIRTAAGHVIELDDTKGSEQITVKHGTSGFAVILDGKGITVDDGSGNGQPIVLAQLLSWLKNHQHIGNLGAPTPLNPADAAALSIPSIPPILSRKS